MARLLSDGNRGCDRILYNRPNLPSIHISAMALESGSFEGSEGGDIHSVDPLDYSYCIGYRGNSVDRKWFLKLKGWVIALVTALVELPKLGKELRDVRAMMIRVLVEVDDPEPDLSEPEPYQKKLRRIRKSGENRLNTGETMLSLSLGALMLISQIWEMGIFQVNFFGVVAEFVIQVGLLVIAVSIGYRLIVMDFLSFSGDEDFHSLKEMDVAVSYQKGVCSVAFVQHLMSMIVLVAVLSRLKKDLAEDLLRIHYSGLSFYKTMREGWRRLNETQ